MGSILGPKCFLFSAYFIISIISVYGVVGAVCNYLWLMKLPDIGEWPFNIRPLFNSFILIQCLFPIVGFFAVLAVCCKRPIFLFGSSSILLAVFTCSSVFGAVSLQISQQEIFNSFYKTFREGINNTTTFTWMNDVQWQHRCCGVYSYMDWYTVDTAINVSNKIPPTCCRRDILPSVKSCGIEPFSNDSITITDEDAEERIFSQGCGLKLAKIRRDLIQRLAIEMCLCGGLSLCLAISIYIGLTRYFIVGTNSCSSNHEEGDQAGNSSEKSDSYPTEFPDENNNAATSFGNSFRHKRSLENRAKKRDHESKRNSMRGPYAPIHSQAKFGRLSRNAIGNISKSKSFIIGDAPSNLLTPIYEEKDPEVLRKNVDMLWYQSLDKNMSTLSTTPNDISSMLLPALVLQSRKQGLGCEVVPGMNDDEAFNHRNTVYTLVGERPCTQSLSQNISSSFVNNSRGPVNGEQNGTGQSSPTSSGCKQQRQRVPQEFPEESPSEVKETFESGVVASACQVHADGKTKEQHTIVESNGDVNNGDDAVVSQQVNAVNTSAHSSSSGTKHLTSSVRSTTLTTLATIDEESESAKGSPFDAKGASPASGSLTPETVSPQQTRTELHPSSHKEENLTYNAEVHRPNNNNNSPINLLNADVLPHSSS